ncbi:MAG: tetratricopeptide repeat protein, partial [Thiogranum sp.]
MVQVKTKAGWWVAALLGAGLLVATTAVVSAEENPESEALFQEGMGALQEDRLKSAIRAFSRILDAEPELNRAKLELARASYRSLRYEDAQKLAQEVLDDPLTPPEVRVTVLA